jgi:hypothetical protein
MKTWAFGAAVALVTVGYMTTCSYESHRGEAAMAKVQKGDSEEKVVALFGPPNTREHQGKGIVGTLTTLVSTHAWSDCGSKISCQS